jgi:hypothetical protein
VPGRSQLATPGPDRDLASEVGDALSSGSRPPYLHSAGAHEIAERRLGKKTEQLYADAEKLHRQLDRHAFGPLQVRFSDEDVDQARGRSADRVRARPADIVDRPLYRELVKTAIKRTHDELQAKARTATEQKKATRAGSAPADPSPSRSASATRSCAS